MNGTLERPPARAWRRLDVEILGRMSEAGILTDPHRVELPAAALPA
ncbi:hypothetical protein DFR50_106193 [Roseiarcus fermentans]|uniref:Uncharacterized protein n=1 Tax=Roseiarcus fermentans TaxID=1473586 RepID=A0A366FQB3_9HYPH|nr:hypothetical protein [Roseiarcus fermentans]RBP16230.1 hypothetical protein DFR50_106193 [Roseiarcus fermentans]